MRTLLKVMVMIGTALISAGLAAQTNCDAGAGSLENTQPKGMTVEELIEKMAERESALKEAQTHYSFTQDVSVQTLEGDHPSGQFRRVSTIHFDHGARKEDVTFAPQSTLVMVSMSKEDFDDLNRSPFVLTKEDLPQYTVMYDGHQQVDQLGAYVLEVAPRKMEKGKRYFQGKVWVEDEGFNVVKSCGKGVPEQIQPSPKKKRKRGRLPEPQNVSPTFVTYREQIEGHWFPTYMRADQELGSPDGARIGEDDSVRIREIVKYTNYQHANASAGQPAAQSR